jgi:nitroreductase
VSDELGLFEVIHSTRSIRRFRDEAVSDELVHRVLDAAIRAPSGAARQHWRFVVVRDAELRRRIGDVYRECFREVYTPDRVANATAGQERRVFTSADYLADHMGSEPPVLIVCCLENEPGAPPATRSAGGSIYPSVQNLMLAARALGLGTCLTTLHLRREQAIKDILDIPDHVDTYALIPLGWPAAPFGPLGRRPVEDVAFIDGWRG